MTTSSNNPVQRGRGLALGSLALATVLGVCGAVGSSAAQAEDITKGGVFGNAPAGGAVLVSNAGTGAQREVRADAKGRYLISALPVGMYTVALAESGQPVAKHLGVSILVGHSARVDFNCAQQRCSELAGR